MDEKEKEKEKARKEMNATLDRMRELRDEVRVKAHLGKMEVKQRYAEIEARLNVLEEQAAKNSSAVSRKVVDDAIRALEKLRDSI